MSKRPTARSTNDLRSFIASNLGLTPIPGLPGIRLHQAGPQSGLWRLEAVHGRENASPYWAYPWSGGLALARHFLDRPDVVAGRRVLDLGAGSGLVAIAAATAGAGETIAADIDAFAVAAVQLNAAANGVMVSAMLDDPTTGPAPAVDLVAVGDLFYERSLAGRVTAFLDRCLDTGAEVLVGDPGRAFLPMPRLRLLAEYEVAGFGDPRQPPFKASSVFAFRRTEW